MVIGAMPVMSAKGAISYLEKADFNPGEISVVGSDEKEIAEIADVSGPLTGTIDNVEEKLTDLGMPPEYVEAYREIVYSGEVLVAIIGEKKEEAIARKMLSQHLASPIFLI